MFLIHNLTLNKIGKFLFTPLIQPDMIQHIRHTGSFFRILPQEQEEELLQSFADLADIVRRQDQRVFQNLLHNPEFGLLVVGQRVEGEAEEDDAEGPDVGFCAGVRIYVGVAEFGGHEVVGALGVREGV